MSNDPATVMELPALYPRLVDANSLTWSATSQFSATRQDTLSSSKVLRGSVARKSVPSTTQPSTGMKAAGGRPLASRKKALMLAKAWIAAGSVTLVQPTKSSSALV
ncbi:hypothetical protein D3C73_1204970 [compost metagenome]